MAEAFIRPIEITTANDSVTVAGVAKTLTNGVTESPLTYLKHLQDTIQTEYANITISLTSEHKVKFTKSDAGDGLLTAIDAGMMLLLGSDGTNPGATTITVPASSSITMDYPVEYAWFPTYQEAGGSRFDARYLERFVGDVAGNGHTSGLKTGVDLEYRKFLYNFEPIANVLDSGEDTSFSLSGTTYYPNQRRNFTKFIDEARASFPATSTNTISVGGCWYVPKFENYEGDSPTWALPDNMTSYNGTTYLQDCAEDRYTYCHLEPRGGEQPKHSIDAHHTDFWSVSFELHTATAPTWTAP